MRQFGLIGYPLGHSFSKRYFAEKFEREALDGCLYENYPLENIELLPRLWEQHPALEGLNVTIPYKQAVIPYLDEQSEAAREVGAGNCIRIKDGRLKGYNTDVRGFETSLQPLLQPHHSEALVLGTGGAAKAVAYVLRKLGIACFFVSRKPGENTGIRNYESLDAPTMEQHLLVINTTPLGMYPHTDTAPPIPYEYITPQHLLYDLVYNPAETLFLRKGAEQGATTKNGHEMLVLQAEASWDLWNGRKLQV